jgi:hypothetical protein
MTPSPVAQWRRGVFEQRIVHLPAPGSRVRVLAGGCRIRDTLCGRYLRANSPEGDDTQRCPDCAAAVDGHGLRAVSGPRPTAGL